MASTPAATVAISATAGALAGGTGYHVIFAPVATSADSVARVFTAQSSLYSQHGYAPGVSYASSFMAATRKPIIFVGMAIATAGAFGQNDASGVTGTSVITTSGTPLEEVDAIFDVTTGGTIGTTGIKLSYSMDGGTSYKTASLGTAATFTVPYLGIVLNFAAGTLIAGDSYTFTTTAPMWDSAGITAAKAALVAQQKLARSWMVIGDVANATMAGYVVTAINAYETANARFASAKMSAADRTPVARKSKVVGQTLTFAEVGATGDTITRSAGSWIADGFKVGDDITITGSVSNNITTTNGLAAVTATVLTLGTDDLVAEAATASEDVTITATTTMADWVAASDSAFASIDSQKRVDISIGRGREQCPITGWMFRRPAMWADQIRAYQHDVHHTTWAKEDGNLGGFSLLDANGTIVEYDDLTVGGASAGRFTSLRTWANGPGGTYISRALTRDTEGSVLSQSHNMAVANVACTIVQAATENLIGKTLVLNDDGTATSSALLVIEEAINTDLAEALLREHVPGEGPRATLAVWRANTTDDLSVSDATLTGVLDLQVNGTIVNVATLVKVR